MKLDYKYLIFSFAILLSILVCSFLVEFWYLTVNLQNYWPQRQNLFYIIFEGGNRNPKYSEMLFGKRSLKEIYRNPAGHTGIFTDLTTNKKTEYCMNMVLAFLKVWVSAIRVS